MATKKSCIAVQNKLDLKTWPQNAKIFNLKKGYKNFGPNRWVLNFRSMFELEIEIQRSKNRN